MPTCPQTIDSRHLAALLGSLAGGEDMGLYLGSAHYIYCAPSVESDLMARSGLRARSTWAVINPRHASCANALLGIFLDTSSSIAARATALRNELS